MTDLHLDYEGYSETDLIKDGLDRYTADPTTEATMCSWAWDQGRVQHWQKDDGPFPREVREGLLDPEVTKWAFNAQFERVFTRRVLKIKTPIKNWRCTMALAYMQSFSGTLERVGRQVGLPEDQQKLSDGKRLIKKFAMPQKVTKNQPFRRRDGFTDPEDWETFCDYNIQDTAAERAIKNRLIKFPIPEDEWELYELDQEINDRGLPIDMLFVRNALAMALRRKEELVAEMRDLTGLMNPNSPAQLTPWLRARGYPFSDINKDTVKKVLTEHEESIKAGGEGFIDEECVAGLKLRQNAGKTSYTKYQTLERSVGADDTLRFTFQFAGAGRTWRWAGRRFQPHNLMRTPKEFEAIKEDGKVVVDPLEEITEAIRAGDYEQLELLHHEPMLSLTGGMRGSIRAPEGYELRVCDLASIETRVTAALSGCERLLNVFASGLDPYIDFATDFYHKPYDQITKAERQISKPPVLGCTYRLGGGELKDGKRTGLWGYAEAMGVNFSLEESHEAVDVFRTGYPEVPQAWYALENAVVRCIRTGLKVRPSFTMDGRKIEMPVTLEYRKPYLMIWLPSGGARFYHLPRITKQIRYSKKRTPEFPDGRPYEKIVFSYMGKQQNGQAWVRVFTHGGKIFENIVQAIARDVLKSGMLRAKAAGFNMRGHVHDEIITLQRKGDNYFTVERLREIMAQPLAWFPTLQLDAAGYSAQFYRKD